MIEFRLLLLNQSLFQFASGFGTLVLSWLVYETTGSKMVMGGLLLTQLVPQIMIQLFAGPYLDSISRKGLMFVSQFLAFLGYLFVFVCLLFNQLWVVPFYLAAFFNSLPFDQSAANAFIPKLVSARDLVRANAQLTGSVQLARLISFPLSGLVFVSLDREISLILVLLLMGGAIFLLFGIKEESSLVKRDNWTTQFLKGLQIYKQKRVLIFLGIFIMITNFSVFATQAMHVPYVYEVLKGSAFDYGLFLASWPFGYTIGSILVGKMKEPSDARKPYYMLGALFIGGSTFLILGLTNSLAIAIIAEIIAGISLPFWNVYSTTIYQKVVPESLRAQVFSVRFLLARCAAPLGILVGTFIASISSISTLYIGIGIFTCLTMILGIILPIWDEQKNFRLVRSNSTTKADHHDV